MMQERQGMSTRIEMPLAVVGTAAMAAIGFAINEGIASELIVGAGLLLAAILVAMVSPSAGISAVLLAAPTMYNLYPMPRGEFSLLELAILTATAGIAARLLIDSMRHGFGHLLDVLTPAQVVVPIGMLLVATVLSLATLADPGHRSESLREVRTVIIEPLLFFAVARMAMRRQVVRAYAGSMLLLSGTVIAGYGIAQILLDLGGVQAGDLTRATATYTHPNNLALFLERTLLVSLGVALVRPRWWPVWLLAVIQFAGLMATFSRGALIALVAGVAALLVLRGLYKWLLLVLAGGIGVAAAGLILFPERLIDAGGSGAEPTRFTIWRASWHMALDHPIFGVGPDQFLYQYSRRYIEPMGWPERYTSHPHNIILDTWLRLGVLGLAAGASLLVGLLWWVRSWFTGIRDDVWSMGALAALVGGLAHGMVDNGFFLPDLATLTWFSVALLVTVPARRRVDEPEAVSSRTPMERTWPRLPRVATGEPVGGGFHLSRSDWIPVGLTAAFLLLQVVPANGYLAFAMIALVGILTITDAPLAVAALVLSIPIQESAVVPFVRGELSYTQIALFGLILGWGVTFYRYRIWLDSIVLGYLAVFAAFSISLVAMDDPGLWVGEVYRWAAAAAFFVICRSVLRSWGDIVPSLWAMVAGAVGVSLHAFWQLLSGAGPEKFVVGGAVRVFSTFGTPNTLAAYLEFTVPLLVVLAFFGLKRTFRAKIGWPMWIACGVATGAGMLTIGLTQSRGGWIGIAVAMGLVFLILPRRLMLSSAVVGIGLVGVFLLTPMGQSQVERFGNVFDEETPIIETEHQGALGRGSLWGAAIRMMADHPATGIGAGEYDYHYREYTPSWLDRFPRGQAHNGWLQMGAQAGVPGLLAFSLWLIASLVALARAIHRAPDETARLLAWGALAVMAAFSVHSLVDYLNVLSLSLQLSAITAIGLALSPAPMRLFRPAGAGPQASIAPSMKPGRA